MAQHTGIDRGRNKVSIRWLTNSVVNFQHCMYLCKASAAASNTAGQMLVFTVQLIGRISIHIHIIPLLQHCLFPRKKRDIFFLLYCNINLRCMVYSNDYFAIARICNGFETFVFELVKSLFCTNNSEQRSTTPYGNAHTKQHSNVCINQYIYRSLCENRASIRKYTTQMLHFGYAN